jgi:glyoxylase-like metal-dependent hydrolase (beta-lactamase superfamily II)
MGVTNQQAGTRVDEVAEGIYRISTPVSDVPGGFSFNQYLLTGDQPLLFHTGPRRLRSLVEEAIASVMEVRDLRFIAFSHYESDECGSLNAFLTLARVLADGEALSLGRHRVRWFDAPHLPHAWECGYLMEEETRTLLCGDLFTQGGADLAPLTSSDILGPSEACRTRMDYYSHAKDVRSLMAPLAAAGPTTLACMHGSAWQGDGGRLLAALAESLDA